MDAKFWAIGILLFIATAIGVVGQLVYNHDQQVIEKLKWQLEQKPKTIIVEQEKFIQVPGDCAPCEAGYEIRAEEQYIWIYKNNTPISFYPRAFSNSQ